MDAPANPDAQVLIFKRTEKAYDSMPDDLMCPECKAKMPDDSEYCAKCGARMKAAKAKEAVMPDVEKLQADLKAAEELVAEEAKKRETAEARIAELEAKVAEMAKAAETPEVLEKRKLEAIPAEIRKRLDDAEAALRKMRDEKADAEDAEIAKRLGAVDRVLPVVKALRGNADALKAFEELVSAAKEQARVGGLFSEIGKSEAPGAGADAFDVMSAKVAELKKADPKLSEADAIAKLANADPDLYTRYSALTRVRARA